MENSRLLTENDCQFIKHFTMYQAQYQAQAFTYTLSLNPNKSFENIITLYILKIHIRA